MSAFDRLPADYRALCAEIGKNSPARIVGRRKVPLSPQNRRVRFAADMHLASLKEFPKRVTRQQRRAAERPWKLRGRA